MKLEDRYKNIRKNDYFYAYHEFFCELTKELDKLSGINEESRIKHYVLADDYCKSQGCLPIRIPGGTVGGIYFKDDVITEIVIDTDYVIKTYPENVNELIQKYVGETIKW